MDTPQPPPESRLLRRTMRDLIALSTLPAVWSGQGRDGIVRSLGSVLLDTLSLDLVYVRLGGGAGKDAIEVVRSKHRADAACDGELKARLGPLLAGDGLGTLRDPFGAAELRVAVTRFGVGEQQGVILAGSSDPGFPGEQDRLLLGVGANQTAVVLQRQRAEERVREQGEWLRVTLDSIGDAVIATDIEGRVSFMNPVAEAMTGWIASEARGLPLERIFGALDEQTLRPAESPLDRLLREGRRTGQAGKALLLLMARDGAQRPIDLSAAPIRDPAGRIMGVVIVFRDIAEQRRAEQFRDARLAVTQSLQQAVDVDEGVLEVLRGMGGILGWDVGNFWSLDDEGEHLACRTTWRSASLGPEAPGAPLSVRRFGKGEGLPGRAWAEGAPVWMPDVSEAEGLPRQAAALGLRGALACPVTLGERTLGVIEFFTRKVGEPDAGLVELMRTVAGSVAQFIERRVAAEELRRSEQQLADFFENATVGLHWVGPDGTILRANRAELEMLGYRREEYVGRSIAQFHADRHVIADILAKLGAGERLSEYPARLRCKDGSIKDVLIDSSVLWIEGRFVHTRCFTRDITGRKQAERALADTSARLNAALEAGAIATWTWDIPENRVYADSSLARLFNLPPSAGEGGLLDEYMKAIHPDDLPGVGRALERALAKDVPYEADYRIVQEDGSVRWVTARGRAVRDETGRAVRMPGVLVEITERKRLEQELHVRLEQLGEANRHNEALVGSLRESEDRLRLLADTIPQLAWMAGPDGSIIWYNRRWYEYTGKTPEEMHGWGWQSVHDPGVLPEVLGRWKRSIAEGTPFEMVFPMLGADGAFRPFLTRVNPLRGSDGAVRFWFGTNTDISDIKRMERALLEADRRKDEFLATLAHELRNPLAPIRNALEILKMPRVDPEMVRQTREMMERQVHHLVRLVDDLLDVARVMRGKIELRKAPMELAAVVARAIETAQPLMDVQGHRLEISVPQESLRVDADPVRLEQVVGNLLTNAAKYTEPKGHVRVSVSREHGEAVLRVRDNGIGIAPDMLPHVFELFVQADHASTRSQGGLGIGLTLVNNLTRMHGGSVEAHSEGLGKGAEFVVRLPLIAAEPAQPGDTSGGAEQRPVVPASGNRVLIVDDNRDAAESLATLLRLQGHDVRVAFDGPSALALAAPYRPHLVLLDLGMPLMDGFEVARRLRSLPGLERLMLVALTGWGQKDDRRRTAAAGFDHHLVKPPEPETLNRLLRELSTAETR